jgi:hypothetical protein
MKLLLAFFLAVSSSSYAAPPPKKEEPKKLEVKVKKPCKPGQTEADGCRVMKKQK